LAQATLGGRRDLAHFVHTRVEGDWFVWLDVLARLDFDLGDRTVLEVGTGWLPVLPLCAALSGVRRVVTVDIERKLQLTSIPRLVAELERWLPLLADRSRQALTDVTRRHDRLLRAAADGGEAVLQASGIDYHAPADARRLRLGDGSMDLICSNSVLEHVRPEILQGLMHASARMLAPGGRVLHSVNCADHYAYADRRIGPLHYLRYSDWRWRLWNPPMQYQNRLRAPAFVAAARTAGLEVDLEERTVREELVAALPGMPLDPAFRDLSPEDLCATSVTFSARKPQS
jgi:hypothetical protein